MRVQTVYAPGKSQTYLASPDSTDAFQNVKAFNHRFWPARRLRRLFLLRSGAEEGSVVSADRKSERLTKNTEPPPQEAETDRSDSCISTLLVQNWRPRAGQVPIVVTVPPQWTPSILQ